jgi:type IX secretion system PorP/SprF family membrane protein
MMTKNLLTIILFSFFFLSGNVAAQDPVYTQFSNTPTYYNPACAGLNEGLHVRFSTRNQSQESATTFRSYYFSTDFAIRGIAGLGGAGIIFNSDNEGLGFIHNYNAGILTSVRVPLSRHISGQIGFKAVWLHKTIEWDEFKMSDQVTERYGNIYDSSFAETGTDKLDLPDFGIGGVVHFNNSEGCRSATIGMAVDHIFEPDQSFIDSLQSQLPRKWTTHADVVWGFKCQSARGSSDRVFKINPGVIFQHQQSTDILFAGANVTKSGLYGGLWYKGRFGSLASTSLAVMAGYRYAFAENMSIKFTYNFDKQIAGEVNGSNGAHEIGLILEFGSAGLMKKTMPAAVPF